MDQVASRSLGDLQTPALLVDRMTVVSNCEEMLALARRAGVRLRPHLKTAKSAAVARLATGNSDGLTVSTVAEVGYFAKAGYRDITYAVGIAPEKVDPLAAIHHATGACINIIVDHPSAIPAIASRASATEVVFNVLIEIDTGAHRAGVLPESSTLLDLASEIAKVSNLRLVGILTHAGHSYHARSTAEIVSIAEQERLGAVTAASVLRAAGFECPTVSIGSTPTVIRARSFEGVTEIRPGVYTLFDLAQYCLGVCEFSNIAASVLTTVIGHNHARNTLVVDAGALALSKDLSASEFRPDFGLGLVCRLKMPSSPLNGLMIQDVYQEHGLIGLPSNLENSWSQFPVGSRLRILPTHVCMTAAAFDKINVVERDGSVSAVWDKARLWF